MSVLLLLFSAGKTCFMEGTPSGSPFFMRNSAKRRIRNLPFGQCSIRSRVELTSPAPKRASTMNYRMEEKEEMILTGYKRHFSGIPGEREEQEKDMYVNTRAFQYILQGLSSNIEMNYDIITNVGDDGYDFYIAKQLSEYLRNNLNKTNVLGEEYAKHFENIIIPKCTYAIFETERCSYPTTIFLDLRKKNCERVAT